MSQVRIGVIGLGMMGRHHGRLCQSLDVFDFVGAVDPVSYTHLTLPTQA